MNLPTPLKVHGLDLSYFTGKLEAYLRGKNISYALVEMDTRDFKRCGKATGVAQMPQVEWGQHHWLSDTTLIIEFLEQQDQKTSVMPSDPAVLFIAQLLEDFGDEWLWRPALYYRWANAADARLMSHRLANGMMRDVPLPFFMRRWAILNRQRFHFLWQDGVRPSTSKRVEAHYLETLDALEKILQHSPFILGNRPTLADYGLYGSMFRHFFCDPTPASIMRTRAPAVHEWVARLWNCKLIDHNEKPFESDIPTRLRPLIHIVCKEFLPYMQLNETALSNKEKYFSFNSKGTRFKLPVQRYRAWRFQRLKTRFQQLPKQAQDALRESFPDMAKQLDSPVTCAIEARFKSLPIVAAGTQRKKMTSRAW